MSQQEAVKLSEQTKIRTVWDDDQEKWFFSIVDVIAVLTESANPRTYWKVLKNRLAKEGNESVTNCNQLKLQAADGKVNCLHLLIIFDRKTNGQMDKMDKMDMQKSQSLKVSLQKINKQYNLRSRRLFGRKKSKI